MEYAALDAACLLGLFDSLAAAAAPWQNAFPEPCRPVTRLTGQTTFAGIPASSHAPAPISQTSSSPAAGATAGSESSHTQVGRTDSQGGSAPATPYYTGRIPSSSQTPIPFSVPTHGRFCLCLSSPCCMSLMHHCVGIACCGCFIEKRHQLAQALHVMSQHFSVGGRRVLNAFAGSLIMAFSHLL